MLKELSKPKPKRGACFTLDVKYVWLYTIRPDGRYVVCDDHTFALGSNFNIVDPLDLKVAPKPRKPIGNNPVVLTAEEKKFKTDLNIFYRLAACDAPANCQECDEPLDCYTEWDLRCATAHILPKSQKSGFPTVACNQANKIFLGKRNCSCHTRYDDRDAKFRSSMKIYPTIILPAFEILKLELSEHDIIRAKKYLNIK